MKKGFKYSLAAVLATSALTPAMAMAATDDTTVAPGVYNNSTGESLTMAEFQDLTTAQKGKWIANSNVYVVIDGLAYKGTDIITLSEEALETSGVPAEDVVTAPDDLTVESVSAINQTIAKSTNTDLKFNVNGDEYTKASFDEKFGEAGYTVEFKYNFTSDATEKAGTVKKSNDFKYAVEVSKDGEKFNTATSADFVEVKVVDADVATTVEKIQLQDSSKKEWKSSTVSTGDTVKIAASEYSNALGQSNLDKDENDALVAPGLTQPTVEKVTSSDVTVAYYDNNDGIKVLADGEVTFTVKFKDIKETKQITVKTVAAQEVSAISADAQKVKAETAGEKVTFTVLDQNDEAVRVDETEVFYTLTKSGDVEATEATSVKTDATGKASVDVNKAEGDYTVNVYTKADKKTKIGSFAVKSVDISEGTIDTYELSFAKEDETTVDVNPGKSEDNAHKLTVNAKASVSGVEVDLPADVKVKSSDEKTFTASFDEEDGSKINVEGLKAGKANVVLYTEEGDLVTTLATLEVEVVNTAPQYTTLTLKPDTKVDGNAVDSEQAVIDAVKEKVTKDQIKKVTPLKADGKVLVEFEAAYGGKTISLDATFTDTSLTKADAVIVKTAGTPAVEVEANVSEAIDFSEVVDEGTIKVDDETYTVATDFDLEAFNEAIADSGVVASGDQATIVLTKADGSKFSYEATKDGSESAIESTEVDNGTEAADAVEGEVQSGTITLTFSEAVNVDEEATIKINDTISGTVATAVEGEKTVTITLDAENAKKVKNEAVTTLDLKAINGSDIVLPEDDAAVKITVAEEIAE